MTHDPETLNALAERVECAVCHRSLRGRVPKGGDGSALVPFGHRNARGGWCEGRLEPGVTIRALAMIDQIRRGKLAPVYASDQP